MSTDDWSDDDSDNKNNVLIGCLRGDIVGLQYYKGMVRVLFVLDIVVIFSPFCEAFCNYS